MLLLCSPLSQEFSGIVRHSPATSAGAWKQKPAWDPRVYLASPLSLPARPRPLD